jgi:hypothetical protein
MARASVGHNSGSNRVNDVVSPRRKGYRFQFSLTRMILEKLSRFRTVTTRNMNGDLVTRDNLERTGADGGLDLIIEIEATSRSSGLQTANRVKNALKSVGQ